MPDERRRHLPKLDRQRYQGHAVVFWTNTVEARERGWLGPEFHARFRELLVHAAARYSVWCPAYCLMPDHYHLIWMGIRRESDQLNAMKFLRTESKSDLGASRRWQRQAHDRVLREDERRRNAFASSCFYILANPVRAGYSARPEDWPYSGAVVPGYPWLSPLRDGYWEMFWRLYVLARAQEGASGVGSPPEPSN